MLKLRSKAGLDNIHRKVYNIFVDIRQLRQKLGMSRDAFARELGVSYKTVYLWEKGKAQPSPLALEKLKKIEKGE